MVIDKLTYPIIMSEMAKFPKYITTTHNGDIGLAKTNILYNATMNKINKAILIDIRKTFDTVDKDILRDTIIRILNPEHR